MPTEIDYGHETGTFDDDDFTQDKYPENRKDDKGWVVIKMGKYKRAGTDIKTGANIVTADLARPPVWFGLAITLCPFLPRVNAVCDTSS